MIASDSAKYSVAPPVELGDRWAIAAGDSVMEVDPRHGARICSFSLKGTNILTGPEIDASNYGSTFWTSPQSDWKWPPVPEVDSEPYTVVESDDGLVCVGSLSPKLAVLVTKRFAAVPGRPAIRVEYSISNQSSEALRLAGWEVSRVRGGLSFFPQGQPVEQPASHLPLSVLQDAGLTWFSYDRKNIAADQKHFAHAATGWLAHLDSGLLLLKTFEAVPVERQAPGEAMIELFASGEKDYIELEQQGPYTKLGPWKACTWQVVWQLLEVPEGLSTRPGSGDLAEFVRAHL